MKIKYSFTGSHSTGKTTSVADLFLNQKIKHPSKQINIICDAARGCPLKINREANEKSQLWIFTNQMKHEIEAVEKNDITITDRTVVDNIAYSAYMKFDELVDVLIPIAAYFIESYTKIYFKTIEKNNYLINDGLRDCNREYQRDIENIMLKIYDEIFERIPNKNFKNERFALV